MGRRKKTKKNDAKEDALHEHGTFNPHPERVDDSLFAAEEFFDPRDLLQLKYEMLRQVQVEEKPVTHCAANFGFSRPAFYEALKAFKDSGLAGLIPKKRGPHGPHKLTQEVMEFVEEIRQQHEAITPEELVERIKERFHIDVHPGSLERALRRLKKKRR
jgi:transposase